MTKVTEGGQTSVMELLCIFNNQIQPVQVESFQTACRMIYYSKQHSVRTIDGRASYALPILWRYQFRSSDLLCILWSRPEAATSPQSVPTKSTTTSTADYR